VAIKQHLTHEPLVETRNRMRLRPNRIMKTIELSTATRPLAESANEIGDEMVVLTDHRKPVAAIVPLQHVDREALALSMNPEFMEIIEQARREVAAGDTMTLEEMKRAVLP
jgi:PHD/YefM family antitoxin component YafN of YafNO toxin-antitoxin module